MEQKVFETVLNDILEDLQQANKGLKEMQAVVSALEGGIKALDERVGQFEQRLKEQQVVAPPADVEPVKQVVEGALELFRGGQAESMQRLLAVVEAQPKNVVKQWRLSLFPDHDPEGRFKHLVDQLTFAALIGAVVVTLYIFGMHWLDCYYAYQADYEKSHPAPAVVVKPDSQPVVPKVRRKHGGMHTKMLEDTVTEVR